MLAADYVKEQNEVKIINIENQKKISLKIKKQYSKYIIKISKRPHIKGIPLNDELLDYIYNLSAKNKISYTLVLAIIQTESNFNARAISKTNDYGIMQINGSNIESFSEGANLVDVDVLNPKNNIAMGIYYLSYLRQLWIAKGYSANEVSFMTILGFNRGEGNAQKYVRKHGLSNTYVTKVNINKISIEKNMEK